MRERETGAGADNGTAQDANLGRVLALSDGVFAIALTLIVLTIRLPEVRQGRADLAAAIFALLPSVANYGLTFLFIGANWLAHHRIFAYIRRYTYRLLLLNLVFLFCISLLPIPTTINFTYGNYAPAVFFYAATVATTGLSLAAVWLYAARRGLLAPHLTPRFVRYLALRSLMQPVAAVFVAGIAAFGGEAYANFGWLVIVPLARVLAALHREERDTLDGGD